MSNEWKSKVIELISQGKSQRKIAKELGVPRSTLGDHIRKILGCSTDKEVFSPPEKAGPKILFIDIETSPILAHVWRLFDQNVGLNQIQEEWAILSYCAKWQGSDEVIYEDLQGSEDFSDDSSLLPGLWKLLNEADIVVGQNSKRFDVKKINARLIMHGYPKPSTFRQIDTLMIAKQQFGFSSNKLEWLTDKLCSGVKKQQHNEFPGHMLWTECMKNNPRAWAAMRAYNTDDVLSLEGLYEVLSSWDSTLPNFDVYVDEVLDMSEWEEDGFHYSNAGKFKRYRNKKTGVQRRSRVNELSKEKRKSLLLNIPQ